VRRRARVEARADTDGIARERGEIVERGLDPPIERFDHVRGSAHGVSVIWRDATERSAREGSSGGELHLLEWSTEGVPMLLLHGFGNEAHIWDDFAPIVAPHYRVVALDHRGHGLSDWDPEGRYQIDSSSDDVEAVTAALGIGASCWSRTRSAAASRRSSRAPPERIAGPRARRHRPEVDARGSMRIRQDVEANLDPVFASVEEYARALSLAYPAATPEALRRMAKHGLAHARDGRFELVMDPALRGITAGRSGRPRPSSRSNSCRSGCGMRSRRCRAPCWSCAARRPTSCRPSAPTGWSTTYCRTGGSRSSRGGTLGDDGQPARLQRCGRELRAE
jgi:pimeloyl-ACP methyl ester carboxylesterase